jgi:uncharacterized MnhB-related membrane protein
VQCGASLDSAAASEMFGCIIVLVLGATGVAQAMLYEIKANDAVSMALAAVGASLIPAVRATTVQPVEVLREE